jgi:hypothetical protein
MVERNGGEVMRHLRALVFDDATKALWSVLLPLVQRILNAIFRPVIGTTPHSLVYVSAPDLERGLLNPFGERPDAVMTSQYMVSLSRAHERLLDITSLQIERQQREYKASINAITPTDFPVGSLVLFSYLTRPPSKLHTRKAGPFIVVSRDRNNVTIRNLTSGDEKRVDASRLTRFIFEGTLVTAQGLAAADLGENAVDSILGFSGVPRQRKSLIFTVLWSDGDITEEPWENVRRLEALELFIRANPSYGLSYLLSA